MIGARQVDKAAIGFSLICIVHCALLPLFAISMPMLSILADAEWIHWLFTILAISAAISTFSSAHSARTASFVLPALSGIALLMAALFAERFGLEETKLTVIGAVLLANAHLFRLFRTH